MDQFLFGFELASYFMCLFIFSSFIPSFWSVEIIDVVKDWTKTSEPYNLLCHL